MKADFKFVISVLCATLILNASVYACNKPTPISDRTGHITPYETITAFSADTTAKAMAVYTDDNNNLKAMLIKYTGDYTGITATINGNTYSITATPEDNLIYEYFDDGIALTDTADVTLTVDDDTLDSRSLTPIKIVSADDGWQTDDGDSHTLTLYTGEDKDIVVPNMYKGELVLGVGGNYDDTIGITNLVGNSTDSITSITLSEGIAIINDYTFFDLSGLEVSDGTSNITIPSTVQYIGYAAFAYSPVCGQLTLPDKLYNLGKFAFFNCSKLTGDLTIPGSLDTVPYAAFYGCTGLNGKLTIGEGVTEIGDMAFAGETEATAIRFTELTLPTTLKKIGGYAFQYCTKVKYLSLPEGLETISDGAFDHMQGIENTTLVIPSTVTTIGGDNNVDTNTGYGDHVFYDMGKSSTFTAFEVSEDSEYFTAVDGVLYNKAITRLVGYPRGKLDTEYVIPEGVTQLDDLSFSRAAYLKRLVLPDSYVLTTEAAANTLNTDGNSLATALYIYTAVEEIAVNDSNPNYTTVNGILYSKDKKTLWYVPNKYTGTVEVADGTETIEKGAIYAASLKNTGWSDLVIPATVTDINETTLEIINDKSLLKGHITADSNPKYAVINDILSVIATGDVNADGQVNEADAALLLKYLSGCETGDKFYLSVADTNADNAVDIKDVIKLITLEETA
jgi:hypothetical protein